MVGYKSSLMLVSYKTHARVRVCMCVHRDRYTFEDLVARQMFWPPENDGSALSCALLRLQAPLGAPHGRILGF
jgi:hypothetical protein